MREGAGKATATCLGGLGVPEFFLSQRSRCGYQKVLKVVPVGYGRTAIGTDVKLTLELLNLEVTYVSNSRYL